MSDGQWGHDQERMTAQLYLWHSRRWCDVAVRFNWSRVRKINKRGRKARR